MRYVNNHDCLLVNAGPIRTAAAFDTVTVLTCMQPLVMAKTHRADGGTTDYDRSKHYDVESLAVRNLDDLHQLLCDLANNARKCIIRGELIDAAQNRRVRRLVRARDGVAATFTERARHWVALDIDGAALPTGVDATDLDGCGRAALGILPAPFGVAGYIVQPTSNHGIKPGMRLRLWFWLSRPLTGDELERWVDGTTAADDSVFRPVQVIYTATPIFEPGRPDPLQNRAPLRVAGVMDSNEDCVLVPDVLPPARPERPLPARMERAFDAQVSESAPVALQEVVQLLESAVEGERHHLMVRFTRKLASLILRGWIDKDDVVGRIAGALVVAGYETDRAWDDTRRALDGALGFVEPAMTEEERTAAALDEFRPYLVQPDDEPAAGDDPYADRSSDGWRGMLISTNKGEPRPVLHNAGLAFAQDARCTGLLAYDIFADKAMLMRDPPWAPSKTFEARPMEDNDASEAAAWLQVSFRILVSSDMAREAMRMVANRTQFHPVRDFLRGLKWDGKQRLDTILIDHLGAEDTPLHRAFGARTLIGAVRRVMEPGCKHRTVLTLEGTQLLGKSSFAEMLVPVRSWFSDTCPEIGNKDALSGLRGKWIQEHGEMANLGKAEAGKAKDFISRTVDDYRPHYARTERSFPRQCIFIATTNPSSNGYLKDETGATRWWPIKCGATWDAGRKLDQTALVEARDQLWAEAFVRYQAHESSWLWEPELAVAQKNAGDERFADEAWGERIRSFINGLPYITADMILADCIHKSVGEWTNAHLQSIGRIMKAAGWVHVRLRIRGERRWLYVPKDPTYAKLSASNAYAADVTRTERSAGMFPLVA